MEFDKNRYVDFYAGGKQILFDKKKRRFVPSKSTKIKRQKQKQAAPVEWVHFYLAVGFLAFLFIADAVLKAF